MKSKISKKIFTILLSILVLFCCTSLWTSSANAATAPGADIPRFHLAYEAIRSYKSYLSISSGSATCSFYIITGDNYTVKVTTKLQQSSDATVWLTKKTWTATGSKYVNLSDTYNVSSGYYYRLYSTVYIYSSDGSLVETASNTSDTVYY